MQQTVNRQQPPMRMVPTESPHQGDAGELSDDDLEHVVGGLARIWVGQASDHRPADNA